MMKIRILNLVLAAAMLSFSAKTFSQELVGPTIVPAGSLATFEVVPAQEISWNLLPTEESQEWFQVDTSSGKLYFASPHEKEFTIVAALVTDGKPVLLTKTFFNEKRDTKPDEDTKPPPVPNASLESWIKTQLPLQVKSQNLDLERKFVAEALDQILTRIDSGTIKASQNAQAQIRIAVTASLTKASRQSVNAWQGFLTQYSKKIQNDYGSKISDIEVLRKVLVKTITALQGAVESKASTGAIQRGCLRCSAADPLQQLFRSKR